MPLKPVPQPPADATAAELQQYIKQLKLYGEEIEAESAKVEQEKQQLANAKRIQEDQIKAQQEILEENQTSMDEQKADIIEREKTVAKMEHDINQRDTALSKKETDVDVRERQLKKKDDHIKTIAADLTKREQDLKAEQVKLETLKRELPEPAEGGGVETAIILQQKELLEQCLFQSEKTDKLIARQLKLEEARERRESERDKKEEQSLATGKGFKPPSFKGVQGERPEAHLLRAEDWLEASNPHMKEDQKIKNFRLTLDHHVREWYEKADCKDTWKKLKLGFSRYFSTQGRSIKNLLTRWKDFKIQSTN